MSTSLQASLPSLPLQPPPSSLPSSPPAAHTRARLHENPISSPDPAMTPAAGLRGRAVPTTSLRTHLDWIHSLSQPQRAAGVQHTVSDEYECKYDPPPSLSPDGERAAEELVGVPFPLPPPITPGGTGTDKCPKWLYVALAALIVGLAAIALGVACAYNANLPSILLQQKVWIPLVAGGGALVLASFAYPVVRCLRKHS